MPTIMLDNVKNTAKGRKRGTRKCLTTQLARSVCGQTMTNSTPNVKTNARAKASKIRTKPFGLPAMLLIPFGSNNPVMTYPTKRTASVQVKPRMRFCMGGLTGRYATKLLYISIHGERSSRIFPACPAGLAWEFCKILRQQVQPSWSAGDCPPYGQRSLFGQFRRILQQMPLFQRLNQLSAPFRPRQCDIPSCPRDSVNWQWSTARCRRGNRQGKPALQSGAIQ